VTEQDTPSPRLQRLIGFLDRDPHNTSLLTEAASLALDERRIDLAAELVNRIPESAAPPPLINLRAVIALARGEFADAVPLLEKLRAASPDVPAIRFNLAWARMMIADYASAHELLDEEAIAVSPRAPALKIQAMHHLGLYEEGLAVGRRLAERYPRDTALMGALATLAMDAEDETLSLDYATRSGDNPDGLSARGMLALDNADTAAAIAMFDRAIELQQATPRAWIGKGLGLLASGDNAAGAIALDRGAELFKDHLGSWIAAGWAHFVNGDYARARANFERAMNIDPNFAENHGGLAVLDLVAGDLESAERRCEIALRLDRRCFGGALAKSMLLDRVGKTEAAQRVRELALSTPIGSGNRTIAQALVGFGIAGRRH
jgi:tetratricopeptide (TPR) repeat protein